MGTKANYFKIGVFVISAVGVLVVGIVVLSAGGLGRDKLMLETYVDESVQGLSVGSAVTQRGVQIGQVERITFVPQEYGMSYGTEAYSKYSKYVMIVMGIRRDLFPNTTQEEAREILKQAVQDGMRLRLATQGLTGLTYVEADYMDPKRYTAMAIEWKPESIYIPAAPSALASFTRSADKVFQTLERIDFVAIAGAVETAVKALGDAAEGAKLAKLQDEFVSLIKDVKRTSRTLMALLDRSKVPEARQTIDLVTVMQSLDKALKALDGAVQDVRIDKVREETVGLLKEIRRTNQLVQKLMDGSKLGGKAAGIPETVVQLNKTLRRIDEFISGRQTYVEEILANMAKASANLRRLTESARDYPSQVLFGVPPPRSETVK